MQHIIKPLHYELKQTNHAWYLGKLKNFTIAAYCMASNQKHSNFSCSSLFILQEAIQNLLHYHSTLRTPWHSADNVWGKPKFVEHVITNMVWMKFDHNLKHFWLDRCTAVNGGGSISCYWPHCHRHESRSLSLFLCLATGSAVQTCR
jgi:hypothetical protein